MLLGIGERMPTSGPPRFHADHLQNWRIMMPRAAALAIVFTLSSLSVAWAQKDASPATPLIQPNVKPSSHIIDSGNSQGNLGRGVSAPSDKNSPANRPGGDESQPTVSSVKCAIVLPEGDGQLVTAAKWLVLAKTCQNRPDDNSDKNPTAGLNGRLFLSVSLSKGNLLGADMTPVKVEDLRLVINGAEIADAKLVWEANDDSTAVLSSQLARTESSKAAWNGLLAQRLRSHCVRVSVAASGKKPLDSDAYFNLQVMQLVWYTWLLLGILVVLALVLLRSDWLKQMLQDDGAHAGKTAAYSLARVQMFYWFVITISCYVLIWLITGDRDTINNDVLTLLGISAGTFLGAASIDANKKAQAQAQLPDAKTRLEQAVASTDGLAARSVTGPAAAAAKDVVTSQQKAFDQLRNRTLADQGVGFWIDILSDADGLSFHRFQILAWSLVLGAIFLASVVQTLSMPTLGGTLLGLMGISGGTYLGFKFPEQKTNGA